MKHALQVLEFDAIRGMLAAHCETVSAVRKALEALPSFEPEAVWTELAHTKQAHDLLALAAPPALSAVRDFHDPLRRAAGGGVLGGNELFEIGDALRAMNDFRAFMEKRTEFSFIYGCAMQMPSMPRLAERLTGDIEPGGDLRDSASVKLGSLRQRLRSLSSKLIERVQSHVSGKHRDLLSDPIYTVRDGRYVIPVKAEHKHKIKGIVHDSSASGQTVYIEPEDVLQAGNALRAAESEERLEVQRILAELSLVVGKHSAEIETGLDASSEADFCLAKAKLAYAQRAAPPERAKGFGIEIANGRHPLLVAETVVPLNIAVGFDHQCVLITGPNTGGKTVAIKAVGLFVLMAQTGLFLPATHVRFAPFTQIWADIGDEQSLQQSLSTFSGHIRNIAQALSDIKEGALVLLDEIGAGTDPAEGAALAKAILERMIEGGARVLASTHYGELKAFAYETPGFTNASMEFDGKSLRPTYRLLMGAPGGSHALKIAGRYGIPSAVIETAQRYIGEEAQQVGSMFAKLDEAQKLARQAQGEADRRSVELRRAEARAAAKLAEADEIHRTAKSKAIAEVEAFMREIRLEAAEIFESLKSGGSPDEARKRLKGLMDKGAAKATSLEAPSHRAVETDQNAPVRGSTVRVAGYSQPGVVLDDSDSRAFVVQIGALKLHVPIGDLVAQAAKPKSGARNAASLQRAQTASTEIHLRGMRAEDALRLLERFIDDATLGGLHQVRIVHGKGDGILRQMTRDYLRKHKDIANVREGEPAEGGGGVTVASLR